MKITNTKNGTSIKMKPDTTKLPKSFMPAKGSYAETVLNNALAHQKADEKRRTQVKQQIKTSDLLSRINKAINKSKTIKK